jgi:uncharacterized protein
MPAAEQIRPFNHTGFNQYLTEGRLMAARCAGCGEIHLPPRALCPICFGTEMEWVELTGEGRLEGYTVVYVGLPAMAAEGYDRQKPYCSGVVRLKEGPAITAQIVGEGGGLPELVEVGMPLKAIFLRRVGREDPRVVLAFSYSTGVPVL